VMGGFRIALAGALGLRRSQSYWGRSRCRVPDQLLRQRFYGIGRNGQPHALLGCVAIVCDALQCSARRAPFAGRHGEGRVSAGKTIVLFDGVCATSSIAAVRPSCAR